MPDLRMPICASAALQEKGTGIRFELATPAGAVSAFVIRYRGKPHGWINRCAHVSVELDWQQGEFFDDAGLYLICATHGAVYEPDTGRCVAGPCKGARLQKVAVTERDGSIFLDTEYHDRTK